MTYAATLRRLILLTFFCLGILAAQPARAALPYAPSDIFLSFRATAGEGSNKAVVVNLGSVTQFTSASGGLNVNLNGEILTDLNDAFGTDWKTRDDVFWSISGVQFATNANFTARTMFASRAQMVPGTQSTPWDRPTLTAAQNPANKMQSMASPGYSAGTINLKQTESTHSTSALIQLNEASNSYTSYMPGGSNTTGATAFSFYTGAGTIENTFANGTANSVLDLYTVASSSSGGPAAFIGAFRMNDNGTLRFEKDVLNFQGPAQVKFDAPSYTVSEDVNGQVKQLTLVRQGNTNSAFTVQVTTSNDTAMAGQDYTALTNFAVTFAAGETSKTVDIGITDRPMFQASRSFNVAIGVTAGNAQVVAPSSVAVTITDSDPQPAVISFSAATYTVAEDGGIASIILTRSGSTAAVSVDFSTTDGTAQAGVDYLSQTNTVVNFTAGQTTTTVDVAVTDRPNFQASRTVNLTLSGGTNGATVGTPGTAVLTITDTDANPAGQIAFSASTYSFASKNAAGQPNILAITLSRTLGTTGAVAVDVSTAAGGNLDGGDFTLANPTTVNFADGVATQTVNIALTAAVGPLPGTFNLQLSNPTGGAVLGTTVAATVTVSAPDKVGPVVKLTSPKAGKGVPTFDVTGTVLETDDVSRVEITLNGGAVQTATLGTKSNGVTPFNLNGLSSENGVNTLLVQAFDSKGTSSKVTKVIFTYSNTTLALEGIYTGLVVPTAATPPSGNVHNASGLLTLTVTKTGTFTGKVMIGGATLPVGGTLSNTGVARFKPTLASTFALASKGKSPVTFGDLSLTVALDAATSAKVTGGIGAVATVTAPRAFFDGKTNLVDPDYLTLNKGGFTAAFPSKGQAGLTNAEFPQGDGVAALTLTKTGKLTLKATLADGTAVTASCPLSKQYRAALYAPLYAKLGSLGGVVTLDKTQADSDVTGSDFLWVRPQQAKAKQYVAGWPNGVKVDLLGARYFPPSKTAVASVFPDLGGDDLTNGNASLVFADGLLTGTQTKNINISAKNKVTNAPATDKTFKVSLVAAKGTFAGTFNHTDGTKPAFKAVLLQKGANAGGYGYFLSLPAKNGPAGQGGGVTISAK